MAIPIFLSHATPHTSQHTRFIDGFKAALLKRGIECRWVTSCDISTNECINAIKSRMSECFGLVALAYERRYVVSAINKNRADIPGVNPSSLERVKVTTPYIQIETSIALAYDLPVLVLKENDLLAEGVLEPLCAGVTGPSFDIGDEDYFSSGEFVSAIDDFCAEVRRRYAQMSIEGREE